MARARRSTPRGNSLKRLRNGAWETVPGAPTLGIEALCAFDDGSGPALYVAGQFTTIDGQPMARITRWRKRRVGTRGRRHRPTAS
jgi:hypothetical protein